MGVVELPADYAAEHVHLGYAATEHGNQGDTTAAIELVTDATSRRGLYVGATRGRTENLMLVVTETHDLDEARDILERVIENDRVDLPAIAQRRELAETDRHLGRQRSTPRPRCPVPHWFDDLANNITTRLQRAEEKRTQLDEMADRHHAELDNAQQRLLEAERLLDPHRPALDSARADVESAQQQVWSSNAALRRAKAIKRPAARRRASRATDELAEARERLAAVEATARPATDALSTAHDDIQRAERSIRNLPLRRAFVLRNVNTDQLHALSEALDTWRRWADGLPVSLEASADALETFTRTGLLDRSAVQALSPPLADWAADHGFEPVFHAPERGASIEIGLEL